MIDQDYKAHEEFGTSSSNNLAIRTDSNTNSRSVL